MSKAKVYLAKSNKSNPNVVSRVRQTLSDYDVEIVEFTGGSYSHKPMVDCDFLVVVPELSESWCEDGVIVGKGLYEQLTAWQDNNSSSDILFILVEIALDVANIYAVLAASISFIWVSILLLVVVNVVFNRLEDVLKYCDKFLIFDVIGLVKLLIYDSSVGVTDDVLIFPNPSDIITLFCSNISDIIVEAAP